MSTDTESVQYGRSSNESDSWQHPQSLITDWLQCSPATAIDPRFKISYDVLESGSCPKCNHTRCPYWMTHRGIADDSIPIDPDHAQEASNGQKSIDDRLVARQPCATHEFHFKSSHKQSPHGTRDESDRVLPATSSSHSVFRFFDLPPELRALVYGFIEQQWEPQDSGKGTLGGESQDWRLRYRVPTALLVSKQYREEFSYHRGPSYPLLVLDTHGMFRPRGTLPRSIKGLLNVTRHLELRVVVHHRAHRTSLHCKSSKSGIRFNLNFANNLLLGYLLPCMPSSSSIHIKFAIRWDANNCVQSGKIWDSLPHDFSGVYEAIADLFENLPRLPVRVDLYEWLLRSAHDFEQAVDASPNHFAKRTHSAIINSRYDNTGMLSAYHYPDLDNPKATTLRSTWDKRHGWRSCRKEREAVSIDEIPFYRNYAYGKGTYLGEKYRMKSHVDGETWWERRHFLHGRGKHIHPNNYKGCTARGLRSLVRYSGLTDPYPQGLTLKWFYWQVVLREGSEEHFL